MRPDRRAPFTSATRRSRVYDTVIFVLPLRSRYLLPHRFTRPRAGSRQPDVLQAHRTDLPGEVRGVSPARLDRADVAADLPGEPSLGARDQGTRRSASDARLAPRKDARHS